MWSRFLKKLGGLKLNGVSCAFFFSEASKEQYEEFKKAFKIKSKIPDYLKKERELYEVGKGNFNGMKIEVFGPHFPNPNYKPEPKEVEELRYVKDQLLQPAVSRIFWEAIVKGIVSFDREKMIALFMSEGLKWDWFYGQALRFFTEKPSSTYRR